MPLPAIGALAAALTRTAARRAILAAVRRTLARPTYRTSAVVDGATILSAVRRSEARAMRKIGSRIRRSARQSIRKTRYKSSKPGQPPRTRRGSLNLRDTIFYDYSARTHDVVIGAVKKAPNRRRRITLDKPFPAFMEFGGTAIAGTTRTRRGRHVEGILIPNGRGRSATFVRRGTRMRYAARPYMSPALRRELRNGKLLAAWREIGIK